MNKNKLCNMEGCFKSQKKNYYIQKVKFNVCTKHNSELKLLKNK